MLERGQLGVFALMSNYGIACVCLDVRAPDDHLFIVGYGVNEELEIKVLDIFDRGWYSFITKLLTPKFVNHDK